MVSDRKKKRGGGVVGKRAGKEKVGSGIIYKIARVCVENNWKRLLGRLHGDFENKSFKLYFCNHPTNQVFFF